MAEMRLVQVAEIWGGWGFGGGGGVAIPSLV